MKKKYRNKRVLFLKKIEKMHDFLRDLEYADEIIIKTKNEYIPKYIEEEFSGVFPLPRNNKKRAEKILKAAEIALKNKKKAQKV